MILYSNLSDVRIDGKEFKSEAVLSLTSRKFIGRVTSTTSEEEMKNIFELNNITKSQISFIEKLFAEARHNNFTIVIQNSL